MPGIQGYATFPGVNQVLEASIDFVHGISPSVASLTIAPQPNLVTEIGDLTFRYGGTRIVFRDCRIIAGTVMRNRQGLIWRFSIFDRRWKWSYGSISGWYNRRRTNGYIWEDTKKTPQELAELLLKEMGETGYDVSALPNKVVAPDAYWDGEPPAQHLARLCDQLSCRVVLGLDNKVRLCMVGVGASLPTGNDVLENSLSMDLRDRPDEIGILCGPDRYEASLELEAVGLEVDGTIQPIDELSYKPADATWGQCWMSNFAQLIPQAATDEHRRHYAMARESIFRWYRIKFPIELPKIGKIEDRKLIEFQDVRLEKAHIRGAVEDNKPTETWGFLPAQVFGTYSPNADGVKNVTPSTEGLRNVARTIDPREIPPVPGAKDVYNAALYRSFRLDAERGLVIFSEIMISNQTYRQMHEMNPSVAEYNFRPVPLIPEPAFLFLRTSFWVRDPKTRGLIRHQQKRRVGKRSGTLVKLDRREELFRSFWSATAPKKAKEEKPEEFKKNCESYLDAMERSIMVTNPQSIRYIGLRAVELDGAVQCLSIDISDQGTFTSASRNNEPIVNVIPWEERRFREEQVATQNFVDNFKKAFPGARIRR